MGEGQLRGGILTGGAPSDMVTASASGRDPDISLANARYQLDRVVGK